MSCRWGRAPAARDATRAVISMEAASIYHELATAYREEDFRWLARSEGFSSDRIETLWRAFQAASRHTDQDGARGRG